MPQPGTDQPVMIYATTNVIIVPPLIDGMMQNFVGNVQQIHTQ